VAVLKIDSDFTGGHVGINKLVMPYRTYKMFQTDKIGD